MKVRDAIICVAVEAPTAVIRGGCYDLRVRTDVRRGDEVKFQVVEDGPSDGNMRDELVAVELLHAA